MWAGNSFGDFVGVWSSVIISGLFFRRMRRFLDFRIVGNVRVRRSWMANSLVVVWAIDALLLSSFEFGKREAVWPSGPIPRIIRSKVFGRSLVYSLMDFSSGREVSKKWKCIFWLKGFVKILEMRMLQRSFFDWNLYSWPERSVHQLGKNEEG